MKKTDASSRLADALKISVAKNGYTGRLNAAHLVLGAGLDSIEPRPVWAWRDAHRCLFVLFETISARQSFRTTVPPPSRGTLGPLEDY
jgi:hypothetical protein